MKTSLLAFVTGMAIVVFSSVAFAGGENCDWKNRGDGHKGMSAEAYKEFKKDHAWLKQEGSGKHDKIIINKDATKDAGSHGIKI